MMPSPFSFSFWNTSHDSWNDWRWQLRESWKTPPVIANALNLTDKSPVFQRYPMQATPFYLSRCQLPSLQDPVLKQCVPDSIELSDTDGLPDPFSEEAYSPVPRLVHRYRDRALFMTTSACAVHCRHCMRKRNWQRFDGLPDQTLLEQATGYVRSHPEIREVLISGGDPLTLDDDALRRILKAFADIPTVEMLRIGSRTPVVLPQRFTEALCECLETCGKTVWIAAHFNHPQELSDEAAQAVNRLLHHGIPVVNQAVLLKGINDDAETLRALFTGLLAMKVKPYYLFHGDPIQGTTHFRTGVEKGLDLMNQLRNHMSGMAMPAFSFDLPEGGGKIRLEPGSPLRHTPDGRLEFDSFEHRTISY